MAKRGGAALNGIDLSFNRQRKGKFSGLSISSSGIGTITTTGDKIDSVHVEFQDERLNGYSRDYMGPLTGSKFIITKFDYQNQIISGEFEFILRKYNGNRETVILKDGRFDFRLNACKCSN